MKQQPGPIRLDAPPLSPAAEAARLEALRALAVLDTAPEPEFDAVVQLAAQVCAVPISLISLLDEERQWFKAQVGLPGVPQTPREVAFCSHTIGGEGPLEVPDARLDARFAGNPLVTGAPHIRFYAGVPLQVDGGARVGSLCVIDREPRQLAAHQIEALQRLALLAAKALQARRAALAEHGAVQALREHQVLLGLLAEHTADGLAVIERGRVSYASPSYLRMGGYPLAEEVGRDADAIWALVHPDDLATLQTAVLGAVAERRPSALYAYRLRHAQGQYYWREDSTHLSYDADGALERAYVIARDISQRKQAEAEIARITMHDRLTGLPNRLLFVERCQRALRALQHQPGWGAVLLLDLDDFKLINDSHGHAAGDDLLRHLADRMAGLLGEGDTLARLGGDEFLLLAGRLADSADEARRGALALGARLLQVVSAPLPGTLPQAHCTGSIGIALLSPEEASADEVIRCAEVAMYEAKATGRHAVCLYAPALQAQVAERAALTQDLRLALPRGELVLYYQPIVDDLAQLTSYEALVRWQHPQRGLIGPNAFIPLAERSGLIVELGQWVLETACQQLRRWAEDAARATLMLAVNVSAQQMRQADFVEQVRTTLERTGAPAHRLRLELTESQLQHDIESTIVKMQALGALGVGFALDDFGTGFSSLNYLKRLPLTVMKIDRSFVQHVIADDNDRAIAKMITQLARTLKLQVVAEGVETQEQLQFLRGLGCDAFQGYLFGRPGPL